MSNFVLKVSAIGILHDNAERLGVWDVERGLIGDDIRHGDGREQADLIQSCLFFFLLGSGQDHRLEGVEFLVLPSLDKLHTPVAATS